MKKLIKGSVILIFVISFQTSFAQTRPKWVAPASANTLKNPVAHDKNVLPEAQKLYTTNCAPCHGSKGRGDGPAAAALNPKPADHSSATIQSESDGSLYWKMSEGRNPMPSYKKILSDQQRWALVDYIRTLKRK